VYLWTNSELSYTRGEAVEVGPGVVSVAAIDYNRDGRLDLLVQRWAGQGAPPAAGAELALSVLLGDGDGGFGAAASEAEAAGDSGARTSTSTTRAGGSGGSGSVSGSAGGDAQGGDSGSVVQLPSSIDQVSIADRDADLWPDLIGRSAALGGARAWWVNEDGTSASVRADEESGSSGSMPVPTQGAVFADVDGDCAADLLVPVVNKAGVPELEVWVNSVSGVEDSPGTPTLSLHQVVPLPDGHGQISAVDVDADGRLDLVFPVCWPRGECTERNELHIMYNIAPACCNAFPGSARPDDCMSGCKSGLCAPPGTFGYTSGGTTDASTYRVVVPSTAFGANLFLTNSTLGGFQVRAGDYNLDGYPDLLAVVRTDGTGRAVLLTNTACGEHDDDDDDDNDDSDSDSDKDADARSASSDGCSATATDMKRRTFKITTEGTAALSDVRDVVAAAFVDIDQVGTLHIVAARDPALWDPSGTAAGPGIAVVFNDFDNDAYFLKTVGLNGVCPAWCKTGPKFPDPKPYGGVQYGAQFQYSVIDLHRRRRHAAGAQLSQSAHGALQCPSVLFGLGRISNYVDWVAMGVPLASSSGSGHYSVWPGVIPNSIVAMTPYPPKSPADWPMWMFISPSEYSAYVLAGIVVSMVITALPIAYCHWREQQEDNREARVNSHAFTFSAL
jgi:integrin alpha FG-GAP repeat containing protein 1